MTLAPIMLFADGGPGVGTGHIFRLYPIFRSLRDSGVPIEMWVPLEPESLVHLGLKDVQAISHSPNAFADMLSRCKMPIVVLDTYRNLTELQALLREQGCRIAVFDDHFQVRGEVSLVVNSSPTVSSKDYANSDVGQLLLGPMYASISSSFAEARTKYAVSGTISRIVVALGGSDSRGNLPALLGATLPLLGTPVEVCVLSTAPVELDIPEHITLLWAWLDQDSLAQRLASCDLAILAGGTMLWQTACIGVPTLSWPQSPGQEKHAAAWESQGAIVAIRDLDALTPAMVKLQSWSVRSQLSNAGRHLVDGLGANRIADSLCAMR